MKKFKFCFLILFTFVVACPVLASHTKIQADILYKLMDGSGTTTNTALMVESGEVCSRDDNADESAFTSFIAKTIVANGGYFCAYQAQCAGKLKGAERWDFAWTSYFQPNGTRCGWFCKKGYWGEGCEKKCENGNNCPDKYDLNSYTKESLSGVLKLRSNCSDGELPNKEWEITYLYLDYGYSNHYYERDTVLAAYAFMPHGIQVTPVRINCDHNGKSRSYGPKVTISIASVTGTVPLLCANGFTDNGNGECVPFEESKYLEQSAQDKDNFCAAYPQDKYDANIHTLTWDKDARCIEYRCRDTSLGFANKGAQDFSCKKCSDVADALGGPKLDGECMTCQLGEYFVPVNQSTQAYCKTAKSYSKSDLRYSVGKQKTDYEKSENVTNQCWTMPSPEDYRNCVLQGSPKQRCTNAGGAWKNVSGNMSCDGAKCDSGQEWDNERHICGPNVD